MYHLRRARRLGNRTRGAAAVEAALVLPVILVIFFAILEFGFLFKDWLGVVSATRAGVRIASAEPRVSTFAQDAANQVASASSAIDMTGFTKLWVYAADSNGNPVYGTGPFTTCTNYCVTFTWDNANRKFVQATNTWNSSLQNACPGDVNHTSIGIYMELSHKALTNAIFGPSIPIKEHVVLSLEPMPTTSGCR